MSLFPSLEDHFCLSTDSQRLRLRGRFVPRAPHATGASPLTLE
jgi:hypothetical protein